MGSLGKNLHLISSAQYSNLQQLLYKRLPTSAMLLNILQLQNTNRLSDKVDIKFYTTVELVEHLDEEEDVLDLNDGASADDTAAELLEPIIITYGVFEYMQFSRCVLFSLPTDGVKKYCDKLLTALDGFIDWGLANLFGDVPEEVTPKLLHVYYKKNGQGHKVDPDPCRFYWLDIPAALEVETPNPGDSTKIQPLSTHDAGTVDKAWDEGEGGTLLQLITESIEKIASFGVYVKKETSSDAEAEEGEAGAVKDDEELVCWVITSPLGSINALHTKETHRRKGYGEMVLKQIIKYNGEIGLMSVAHVRVSNTTSQQLMEKVGLKCSHNVNWLLLNGIRDRD